MRWGPLTEVRIHGQTRTGRAMRLCAAHETWRQFSAKVLGHEVANHLGIVRVGEHVHQFGQRRFGRHVVAWDDAAPCKHVAGGVQLGVHPPVPALRHVDHGDAAVVGVAQEVAQYFVGAFPLP